FPSDEIASAQHQYASLLTSIGNRRTAFAVRRSHNERERFSATRRYRASGENRKRFAWTGRRAKRRPVTSSQTSTLYGPSDEFCGWTCAAPKRPSDDRTG